MSSSTTTTKQKPIAPNEDSTTAFASFLRDLVKMKHDLEEQKKDDTTIEFPTVKRRRFGKELHVGTTYHNPLVFRLPNYYVLGYHYSNDTMDLQFLNCDDWNDCWEVCGLGANEVTPESLCELYDKPGIRFGLLDGSFVADFGKDKVFRKPVVQMTQANANYSLSALLMRIRENKEAKFMKSSDMIASILSSE